MENNSKIYKLSVYLADINIYTKIKYLRVNLLAYKPKPLLNDEGDA